ncbi:hypothetical protein ASPWEDRAFT_34310 [Aspergillus wentii DTO 134E9]|uniref:Enoyl reductase (ER) domain-containing protein n=1 Tax=Aspergillus wentii DTO 134E9 TaxID=1073089 RepID=A0A1L9S0Z4_ASPWE|nr:uncharacterized protein ASPWEDRAFT_34310 [Aspergillus wentii DTO 134E9]OJJ40835.1 hypothetical protein ASPWEDRAFT_34310 [Aspergillus wentii DTO 134E9]
MDNKSLVIRTQNGQPTLVTESLPLPQPGSHQAVVKVSHVAQNPTDVQSFVINAFGDGSVLGCDFVGQVVKLGDAVTRLKEGDTVAGLIWGGEFKGLGAYSEYTLVDENVCFKPPSGIKPEQAATVPLAAATAWLASFSPDCLNIDRRRGSDVTVLIWGGSSSVGLYAIQIASLYNFQIITTCRPKHFDLVRSLGAQHVYDYRDESIVDKIQQHPNLTSIFDTIGSPSSSVTASQTLTQHGTLCTVRPGKAHTQNVTTNTTVTDVLVWTAFLKDHRYGDFYWPASKTDHSLAIELFNNLPEWLATGKIQPSKAELLGKLNTDTISRGFRIHREGGISGFKIVYSV